MRGFVIWCNSLQRSFGNGVAVFKMSRSSWEEERVKFAIKPLLQRCVPVIGWANVVCSCLLWESKNVWISEHVKTNPVNRKMCLFFGYPNCWERHRSATAQTWTFWQTERLYVQTENGQNWSQRIFPWLLAFALIVLAVALCLQWMDVHSNRWGLQRHSDFYHFPWENAPMTSTSSSSPPSSKIFSTYTAASVLKALHIYILS